MDCQFICKYDEFILTNLENFKERWILAMPDWDFHWKQIEKRNEQPNINEFCVTHGVYDNVEKIFITYTDDLKLDDVVQGWVVATKINDSWTFGKIGWDTFDSDCVCKLHSYTFANL